MKKSSVSSSAPVLNKIASQIGLNKTLPKGINNNNNNNTKSSHSNFYVKKLRKLPQQFPVSSRISNQLKRSNSYTNYQNSSQTQVYSKQNPKYLTLKKNSTRGDLLPLIQRLNSKKFDWTKGLSDLYISYIPDFGYDESLCYTPKRRQSPTLWGEIAGLVLTPYAPRYSRVLKRLNQKKRQTQQILFKMTENHLPKQMRRVISQPLSKTLVKVKSQKNFQMHEEQCRPNHTNTYQNSTMAMLKDRVNKERRQGITFVPTSLILKSIGKSQKQIENQEKYQKTIHKINQIKDEYQQLDKMRSKTLSQFHKYQKMVASKLIKSRNSSFFEKNQSLLDKRPFSSDGLNNKAQNLRYNTTKLNNFQIMISEEFEKEEQQHAGPSYSSSSSLNQRIISLPSTPQPQMNQPISPSSNTRKNMFRVFRLPSRGLSPQAEQSIIKDKQDRNIKGGAGLTIKKKKKLIKFQHNYQSNPVVKEHRKSLFSQLQDSQAQSKKKSKKIKQQKSIENSKPQEQVTGISLIREEGGKGNEGLSFVKSAKEFLSQMKSPPQSNNKKGQKLNIRVAKKIQKKKIF